MSEPNGRSDLGTHILMMKDKGTGVDTQIGEYEMIGISPLMTRLYGQIGYIAPTPFSVHIVGERGTGKELVAMALHNHGPSSSGLYVALNCTTVPEDLLESELFGHEKGAFTGATERRKGLVELADKGTLFIDEIDKIGLGMQHKLLRQFDGYKFRRVGGAYEISSDVRVITASRATLESLLALEIIIPEFYDRINCLTISVPPLRERGSDIRLLADYFLATSSNLCGKKLGFTEYAYRVIEGYEWPGNVRQLMRVIEAAVALKQIPDEYKGKPYPLDANDIAIPVVHVPEFRKGGIVDVAGSDGRFNRKKNEEALIIRALERTGGNRTKAAKLLGTSVRTVRNKIREYGIDVPSNGIPLTT